MLLSREATYFLIVCSLLPTRPEVKGIPGRILLFHFCDLIKEIVMEYKLGEGLGWWVERVFTCGGLFFRHGRIVVSRKVDRNNLGQRLFMRRVTLSHSNREQELPRLCKLSFTAKTYQRIKLFDWFCCSSFQLLWTANLVAGVMEMGNRVGLMRQETKNHRWIMRSYTRWSFCFWMNCCFIFLSCKMLVVSRPYPSCRFDDRTLFKHALFFSFRGRIVPRKFTKLLVEKLWSLGHQLSCHFYKLHT